MGGTIDETDVLRARGQFYARRGVGERNTDGVPLLSDFEDVVKSEKLFMHDWNVFMRRYKPFGDKELPDAYHAFAHYRGKQLAADPELRRLFTLHLINAWDFSVIESSVIDEVLKVVQGYCSSLPAGLSSESLQGKKGKQKEAPPHGV